MRDRNPDLLYARTPLQRRQDSPSVLYHNLRHLILWFFFVGLYDLLKDLLLTNSLKGFPTHNSVYNGFLVYVTLNFLQ